MGVDDVMPIIRFEFGSCWRFVRRTYRQVAFQYWYGYRIIHVLHCTCFLEDDGKAIPVDSKRFLHSVRVCMYSRFVFKSEHLLQYARSSNPMSRFPVTLCMSRFPKCQFLV